MDQSLIQNQLLTWSVQFFAISLALGAFAVATQNWLVRGSEVKRWEFWRIAMIGIPLLVVALIASLLVAPRLVRHPNWSTATSRSGNFSISFPGEVREVHQTVPVPKVGDCPASIFTLDGGRLGVSYMAQVMEYPDGAKRFKGHEKDTLDGVETMTLRSMTERAKISRPITYGAYPGIEFTYSSPKGVGIIQTRAYLVGSRLYMMWAGPLKNTDDPNGTIFFQSFKITDEHSATRGLKDTKQ